MKSFPTELTMWIAGNYKKTKPTYVQTDCYNLLYPMNVLLKMVTTVHFLKHNIIIQQIQSVIGKTIVGGREITI